MPETDPIILTLLLLKNNWSLTGDLTGSSITFTTGWYDTNISTPQVCIRPAGGDFRPLTTGLTPFYQYGDAISVAVYVRPKQDSNTSIGWAKSAMWKMRKEVERIFKAGAELDTGDNEQFTILRGWREVDMLTVRPVVFGLRMEVVDNYFRTA